MSGGGRPSTCVICGRVDPVKAELYEAALKVRHDIINTPPEDRTYRDVNTAIHMLMGAIEKAEGRE